MKKLKYQYVQLKPNEFYNAFTDGQEDSILNFDESIDEGDNKDHFMC